jgi:hypothetical protein
VYKWFEKKLAAIDLLEIREHNREKIITPISCLVASKSRLESKLRENEERWNEELEGIEAKQQVKGGTRAKMLGAGDVNKLTLTKIQSITWSVQLIIVGSRREARKALTRGQKACGEAREASRKCARAHTRRKRSGCGAAARLNKRPLLGLLTLSCRISLAKLGWDGVGWESRVAGAWEEQEARSRRYEDEARRSDRDSHGAWVRGGGWRWGDGRGGRWADGGGGIRKEPHPLCRISASSCRPFHPRPSPYSRPCPCSSSGSASSAGAGALLAGFGLSTCARAAFGLGSGTADAGRALAMTAGVPGAAGIGGPGGRGRRADSG